jgi:hypothetical protein
MTSDFMWIPAGGLRRPERVSAYRTEGSSLRRTAVAIAALAAVAPCAHGDFVSITASRDATLYESVDGSLANGAGQYLFAGETNQNLTRRAVLWFDIAAFVPSDATVTSVRLVLNVSQANGGNRTMTVHRALTAWTTGASDPDGTEAPGAPALAGDATWLHASADGTGGGTFWLAAGGDYAAAASASLLTTTLGLQTWTSAALAADVQAALANPAANLGWFIVGDESAAGTARRFDSADSAALGGIVPRLEIEFTPIPTPAAGALLALGALARPRRRR